MHAAHAWAHHVSVKAGSLHCDCKHINLSRSSITWTFSHNTWYCEPGLSSSCHACMAGHKDYEWITIVYVIPFIESSALCSHILKLQNLLEFNLVKNPRVNWLSSVS